jgi:coenzyme PQQ precursor peptide PqqA
VIVSRSPPSPGLGAFATECQTFLSEFLNLAFRACSWARHAASIGNRHYPILQFTEGDDPMKEWLKPEITESEAGMEVTSYLPAELDRA